MTTTLDAHDDYFQVLDLGNLAIYTLSKFYPNAEHDIYGCPGISDKEINKVLDEDAKAEHSTTHKCFRST